MIAVTADAAEPLAPDWLIRLFAALAVPLLRLGADDGWADLAELALEDVGELGRFCPDDAAAGFRNCVTLLAT